MKSALLLACTVAGVLARSPFAGINIAGFDFGSDIQGAQNISNSFGPVAALGNGRSDGAAQMQHFVQNDGLDTFRLPVTWQFLINSRSLNGSSTTATGPASNGTLDRTNMAQYNQLVRSCLATGASCIIDIHNYARFEGQVIGQGGPTNAQFGMLWSQLASMYRNETKVIFGIMNEPHDLPNLSTWADTVQVAVTAIRRAGATTQTILLPGTEFTHASSFVENGSAGNLSRVTNPDGSITNLVFEVHQYLDADGSGTSLECVTDHVQDGFMPLAQFLVKNGRKALLGEIGGGNTTSCLTNLRSSLAFVNNNPDAFMGYTAWSAGGFSPLDYNLTMTPKGSPGNFVDQETVTQCVVATRNAVANATASGNSTAGLSSQNSTSMTGQGTSSAGSGTTVTSVPVAASTKLAAGKVLETLAALAVLMLWVV
ncbi:glycoside hydrolase superfamily [Biscogniauxia sp. FL1348]|nr:glycoside hydrolase superfamily [Biscogniauxia sp. FL1348]